EPAPVSGTAISITEACAGGDPVNLFDLIEGEDEDGIWTTASGTEIDSLYDPSIAGDFPLTYTVGSTPCEPVSTTLTLNVLPEPNPGQAIEDASVCLSDGTINLFD